MRGLFTRALAGEFARYFVSGLIAVGVDITLYVSLTELANWHYIASAGFAFCAGLATLYVFSVFWVFRERRVAGRLREFLLFAAIGVVGLLLNTALIYALTEQFGIDYRISKVGAIGMIFMFNFVCRKILLFRVKLDPD